MRLARTSIKREEQQQSSVVEVKVDAQGRAVPIGFWVASAITFPELASIEQLLKREDRLIAG